jgi:serine O-acetyltransferase
MTEGASTKDALTRLRETRLRIARRGCVPLAQIALRSAARDLIVADAQRWPKYTWLPSPPPEGNDAGLIAALAATFPEFRTLLYYRLNHDGDRWAKSLVPVLRKLWRPHPTLRFSPNRLGPGCFILHGYATGIAAKSIGANFIVGQHVVIGFKSAGQAPTIGDNVTVYVGAIVIGDITIGDGAVIGAGAVVVHDVSAGATVVGPAARELDRH